MILGITGGSGCGKTTLLDRISALGGQVYDCDAIYHDLLRTDTDLLDSIAAAFPGVVENGQLDRKKLGSIVFSDETRLKLLNSLTHAAVKREILTRLDKDPPLAAIDAIALHEGGLAELCDVTVAVTAPEDARIRRLMARDGITEAYARSRIAAQHDESWFRRHCDHVLKNDGTREEFQGKCLAFLDTLDIMKEKTQRSE